MTCQGACCTISALRGRTMQNGEHDESVSKPLPLLGAIRMAGRRATIATNLQVTPCFDAKCTPGRDRCKGSLRPVLTRFLRFASDCGLRLALSAHAVPPAQHSFAHVAHHFRR